MNRRSFPRLLIQCLLFSGVAIFAGFSRDASAAHGAWSWQALALIFVAATIFGASMDVGAYWHRKDHHLES